MLEGVFNRRVYRMTDRIVQPTKAARHTILNVSRGSAPAHSKPVSTPDANAPGSPIQGPMRGDTFHERRPTSEFSNMAITSVQQLYPSGILRLPEVRRCEAGHLTGW